EIALNQGDTLEMLALIDTASLERLGSFAGLQSGQTAQFMATMPAISAETTAKFSTLTTLKADLSKLEANFGPGHPEVEIRRKEIMLVEKLIRESKEETQVDS